MNYIDLNAQLNLWGERGELQLDADKQAAREYFIEHVNKSTRFFHDEEEKVKFLVEEEKVWDRSVALRYGIEGFKELSRLAFSFKFRFQTFIGAYKFYNQYALKSSDGKTYLERYEDRVVLTALAYSDDLDHAKQIVTDIIEGRFQPATPTFLNAGRVAGGEAVSCFLLRVEDNMESISRAITDSLQLSKRGGGVSLCLTNIRESGAAIKGLEGQASGLIPVMKILEDSFSYANQLGARQGAGAVYINVHHPDVLSFLDTKRENADEKIRIKTLSLGLVVPDITFELARKNENMYLFSPKDIMDEYGVPMSDISISKEYSSLVNNPRIRKTSISARKLFQTIAEVQAESGYPYLVFDDTINRGNPVPNVGRIVQSNLCSEIAQPQTAQKYLTNGEIASTGVDVACNLGSLNVAKMAKIKTKEEFASVVDSSYRFLDNVARRTSLTCSPSIENGNSRAVAIGLGQMNLHGYFIERGLDYGSPEARNWFRSYMSDVTYFIIQASNRRAKEKGSFYDFKGSKWEDGSQIQSIFDRGAFSRFGIRLRDWNELEKEVSKSGLANQNLQAIPPTGSISYINHSTPSIHPVTSKIEIRKEGMIGRVYSPAYGMTEENHESIKSAYEYPPEVVIDMYAIAARYVDQSSSLTLFFKDSATTRDINRAQIYAWRQGVKSIYYIRMMQKAIAGTEVEECVSCVL